jgi:hypothetical protein
MVGQVSLFLQSFLFFDQEFGSYGVFKCSLFLNVMYFLAEYTIPHTLAIAASLTDTALRKGPC